MAKSKPLERLAKDLESGDKVSLYFTAGTCYTGHFISVKGNTARFHGFYPPTDSKRVELNLEDGSISGKVDKVVYYKVLERISL